MNDARPLQGLFLLAAGLIVYFLPSAIGRKKRNAGAIFALNLLTGWTVIGWIASLVWSLTKDSQAYDAAHGMLGK